MLGGATQGYGTAGNAIAPAPGNALAAPENDLAPWRSTRRALDPNMFRMRRFT